MQLGLNDVERGLATTKRAIVAARRSGTEIALVDGQLTLARCLLRGDREPDLGQVEDALAEAQAVADAIGYRLCKGEIRELHAELARVRGDESGYERGLREAREVFVEMGAVGEAERLAKKVA